jgi:hypothetical protein
MWQHETELKSRPRRVVCADTSSEAEIGDLPVVISKKNWNATLRMTLRGGLDLDSRQEWP